MKLFQLIYFVATIQSLKSNNPKISSGNPNLAMNLEKATSVLQTILKDYRKEVVPIYNNQPVVVKTNLFINDMVPLENIPKHFSVDFTLRMIWMDKRLAYDSNNPERYAAFDAQVASLIWIPNIYFPLGKKGVVHELIAKNVFILIYGNGTVKFSQRLTVLSFCPMKFRLYPFDIQDCTFKLEAFAQSKLYVELRWMEKPIERSGQDLHVPDYSYVKIRTNKSIHKGDFDMQFDTLEVKFTLHRDFTLHFLRDFFPCILTVMLSWVSFFLSYKSTPARSTFGITTVLTIVTMSNNIRSTAPSAKTFRSLDYYMLICMIFVFGALVEFAIVGITDPDFSPGWKNKGKRQKTKRYYEVNEPEKKENPSAIKKIDIGPFVLITGDQHVIDNCAKILFPLSFLFVNAVYFTYHRVHPETVNK